LFYLRLSAFICGYFLPVRLLPIFGSLSLLVLARITPAGGDRWLDGTLKERKWRPGYAGFLCVHLWPALPFLGIDNGRWHQINSKHSWSSA
jgi:hypothetical protein